jgi:hypothetical protein
MRGALVAIVEGHGEVESVPQLLRRLLSGMGIFDLLVLSPLRKHRDELLRAGRLEKAVVQAARLRTDVGAVLVLLDADHDCPAVLGPQLLSRAQKAGGIPVSVVLAKREFEAWILASLETCRGTLGIPEDAVVPEDPENVGAKGSIRRNTGQRYSSAVDQQTLARLIDPELARKRSPSFDKFVREVERLAKLIA